MAETMAGAPMTLDSMPPLSRFRLFESAELDEVREAVARVFKPHALDLRPGWQSLDARQHFVRVGDMALSYLQYGAEVDVNPGLLDGFFLMVMPLSGALSARHGDENGEIGPGGAHVYSPSIPLFMRWGASAQCLAVRVDRTALERYLVDYLGAPLSRPIEFDLTADFSSPPGRRLARMVRHVFADADDETTPLSAGPAAKAMGDAMQESVFAAMLSCQHHTYSDAMAREIATVAPYYVKRVEEFIRANADQPLAMCDLAAVAGVSARAIYQGFRRYRGIGPIAFAKLVRLERAHADLVEADPAQTSVSEIAARWGFVNFGHFAGSYAERFGENPSATLRRGR